MVPAAVAPAVIKNLRLDRFDIRDKVLELGEIIQS